MSRSFPWTSGDERFHPRSECLSIWITTLSKRRSASRIRYDRQEVLSSIRFNATFYLQWPRRHHFGSLWPGTPGGQSRQLHSSFTLRSWRRLSRANNRKWREVQCLRADSGSQESPLRGPSSSDKPVQRQISSRPHQRRRSTRLRTFPGSFLWCVFQNRFPISRGSFCLLQSSLTHAHFDRRPGPRWKVHISKRALDSIRHSSQTS